MGVRFPALFRGWPWLAGKPFQLTDKKLEKELDDLVELDMSLPLERKRGVGLLLAFRPWVFSLLDD
jgi:hypothetical protein